MTAMQSASGPIAILVVHGIGAQKAGESARKLMTGLARGEGTIDSSEHEGVITVGGQPVRVYEVYWADLLTGDITRGAFEMKELQSLSWFPWFNHRRGNYRRGHYSFAKLAWWWIALPVFNFFALFAYYGAGPVAQRVSAARRSQQQGIDTGTLSWNAAKEAAAQSSRLTMLDAMLDEYVGDVFSYVNSAGNAFYREKDETPIPPAVERIYEQIVQRFYDQLLKAQADGCAEIQVVAHSLGTVVAYHALSGLRFEPHQRTDADAIQSAKLTVRRLYTIGSPLEKIRFFWPQLVPGSGALGGATFQWDNFVSWFDPVAGTLKRFGDCGPIANHHLLGGGFFRGHVVYEHSPVFLGALTQGLCGREIPFARSRRELWRDRLVLIGETLLAPALVVFVLMLGGSLFLMTALLLPYLLSLVLRQFLAEHTWVYIENMSALVLLGMMVLAFLLGPMIRASKVHRLHWVAPKS